MWHRLIKSKYGVQQNRWDANQGLVLHMQVLGNLSQVYPPFSTMLSLHVGDGYRVQFWEDYWTGEASSLLQFLIFLDAQGNHSFWNFHFPRNLNGRLVDGLALVLHILVSLCQFFG